MELVTLESQAFQLLIEKVIALIRAEHPNVEPAWLPTDVAMKMLGVKSKTTLALLRNSGKIRYTTPQPKIFLYSAESIKNYLELNAKNEF